MKMRSKVITFINKCRKLLFKLNVIFALSQKAFDVAIHNGKTSKCYIFNNNFNWNLLINRFEEKDSFKDIWLAGSCFLCMLNRETFSTFINQERPGADFTFTVTFLLFGGYY